MLKNSINAKMLQKMFLAGANSLEAKKEYINELNVFPVPDGDTGTNMTMTVMSAAKAVASLENPDMDELGKAISGGALRGARGNSGVIMSQIFRGFTKSVKGYDELDAEAVGNAVSHAADTAYKAVMKPKEGTILTVASAGKEKAMDMLVNGETEDLEFFIDEIIKEMETALLNTPEQLPVLKQAGVVDSGGEGLMTFLRGAVDALKGRVTDFSVSYNLSDKTFVMSDKASIEEVDIKFGYCTEFIIMLERENESAESQLKEYLQKIGDCVVVVSDDDIVKVHVHTNDPGLAIQKALTYGSLTSMKIDNMREEHHEKVIKDAEKIASGQKNIEKEELEKPVGQQKETGFIAVVAGDGLKEIYKELGVDYCIEGGQTMNPSTEDILNAIGRVNAKNIFILPNNGNIILAANQARDITNDKNVIVIPTTNIPQGIAAMLSYVAGQSPEENEELICEEIKEIKCGQVTYAVRDTEMDGRHITKGDYMGLSDKNIVSVGKDMNETAGELVSTMLDEDSELVSIYYGEGVDEDDADALADLIVKENDFVEVEVQYGGQPVYAYFVSVE